jgi:hypothetical protein
VCLVKQEKRKVLLSWSCLWVPFLVFGFMTQASCLFFFCCKIERRIPCSCAKRCLLYYCVMTCFFSLARKPWESSKNWQDGETEQRQKYKRRKTKESFLQEITETKSISFVVSVSSLDILSVLLGCHLRGALFSHTHPKRRRRKEKNPMK